MNPVPLNPNVFDKDATIRKGLNFRKHKRYHIPVFLAVSGLAFTALHLSPHQPLFTTLDTFVLFADEGVALEDNTQVSSGNIGSNSELTLNKNVLVSGNLFADKITLDKDASVNGNASYNKLRSSTPTQILGTHIKPVSLPIANLPILSDFTVGTTSLTISGTSTILSPNNYRDIILAKGSTLTLQTGTYTLRSLEMKEGSMLMFTGTTTLNIQRALKGEKQVSILPGQNTRPDQLTINYNGFKEKSFSGRDRFDDDKDAGDAFDNDSERKDWQKGISAQPIVFGERAFLNFKLIAPRASVTVGKESIVRGQVLARKIGIRKDSVASREETQTYITKPEDMITNPAGGVYPVNEILVFLRDGATLIDAEQIAGSVNGRIVGNVAFVNLYQILIPTRTIFGVQSALATLQNSENPLIEGVTRNFIIPVN